MPPATSDTAPPRPSAFRRTLRGLAVIAVALAGVGAVATVWATPRERPGIAMADQRVGMCHRFVDPNEFIVPWDQRPPVPCDQPHESETIDIERLPAELARHRTIPSNEALSLAVPDLCTNADVAGFVGSDAENHHWFLELQVRFPSPDEWARGERRYRCDLAVAARDGDGRPTRRGSLRGVMRRAESAALRQCVADGRLVPCSKPHTGELVTYELAPQQVDQAAVCDLQARSFVGGELVDRGLVSQLSAIAGKLACTVAPEDGEPVRGTRSAQVVRS